MNIARRLREIEKAVNKTMLCNHDLLVVWPWEDGAAKRSARLAELRPKYPTVKESDIMVLRVFYDECQKLIEEN